MKLLVESRYDDNIAYDVLVEKVNNVETYYIEGPFIQTNIKNRNNRNYPRELMNQAVAVYVQDRMDPQKGYRSYGELGHPEGVEINPDRISHYTTSLNWQGDNCIGKAEVLDTPFGEMVKTFLRKKLRLATSTRGLGTLSERKNSDGSQDVESYEMLASDIVIDPSAPEGFVEGVLESKDYVLKANESGQTNLIECYDGLERIIQVLPKHSQARKEHFGVALHNFLKEL
jgi:hypothetical protein